MLQPLQHLIRNSFPNYSTEIRFVKIFVKLVTLLSILLGSRILRASLCQLLGENTYFPSWNRPEKNHGPCNSSQTKIWNCWIAPFLLQPFVQKYWARIRTFLPNHLVRVWLFEPTKKLTWCHQSWCKDWMVYLEEKEKLIVLFAYIFRWWLSYSLIPSCSAKFPQST